jgi:hypothetical protein
MTVTTTQGEDVDTPAPAEATDAGVPAVPTPTHFRRVKRGRWWSYQLDGRKLPSVTRLIGDGVPKPNLIDWAARAAAEWAADNVEKIAQLDRAAAIDVIKNAHNRSKNYGAAKGTDVHHIAQALALGEAVEVPEAITGYVDAYLAFLSEWSPEVLAVEAAIVSRRWCYAGTFDVLMNLPGITTAAPVMVDVKTGGTGVWPETCLQLAAYRYADAYVDADNNEQPMVSTAGGYALWLADDGTYELLPVECGPDIFATFLHAAHVAAFAEREREELIGLPLEVPRPAAAP